MDYHDMLAHQWVHNTGVLYHGRDLEEAANAQYEVLEEEYEELEEAFDNGTIEDIAEESADLIVTVRILNTMLGIYTSRSYEAKMHYNLMKSGAKDENGKVIDDAPPTKPDFGPFTIGDKPW